MSFIFGGNTNETAESIRRKRAVAAAMQQQAAPRDLGSGLTYASGKIASALIERKARDEQKKGEDAWRSQWGDYLGGQQGTPFLTPEQSAAPVETAPMDPLSPEMIQAVIRQESGGNPEAVSPKGATGLMQIMPATARDPGFGVPNVFDTARQLGRPVPDESDATLQALLRDPAVNEAMGTAYLGAMSERYGGDMSRTLAAYNAGPGAVDEFGGVPPFDETQNYVRSISAMLGESGPQMAPQPSAQAGPMGLDPRLLALASNDFMPENMRPIVTALLQQEMARNAPPEALTPFQQETLDLRRRELDARLSGRINDAPVVNVDARGPAPDKFAERTGTVLADETAEVAKTGAAASANLRAVDRLEGLLSRAPTGGMAAFQQMLGEFGIETQGLSEIQAAQALINKLVPEQRAPGTGPMSDADLALFKQSMPRIINTPDGNRLIIETLRNIANYDIQRGQIARELQLGRMSFEEATAAWDALANPLEGFTTPDAAPSGRNATRLRFNPETGELE